MDKIVAIFKASLRAISQKATPIILVAILVVGGAIGYSLLAHHQTQAVGPEPVWGLPYPPHTPVSLGILGLHPDTQNKKTSSYQMGAYTLTNVQQSDAALDLGIIDNHFLDGQGNATQFVTPLAAGNVLAVDSRCDSILIDHGNNWWVLYRHLSNIPASLTIGARVFPNKTPLGYPTMNINPSCEITTYVHVHFAFLHGSGHTGSFVSMHGMTLCGHSVLSNSEAKSEQGSISINLKGLSRNFDTDQCFPTIGTANIAGQVFHLAQTTQLKEPEQDSFGFVSALINKPTRTTCQQDNGVLGAGNRQSVTFVVALDNQTMIDANGNVYYKVAYPDACNRWDYSSDQAIYPHNQSTDPAVGYVNKNDLTDQIAFVQPSVPNAVWRCWEPRRCGDQHLGDTASPGSPKWPDSLRSADGNVLYAWWDSQNNWWDPHWFHVLNETGTAIAVYGRDWANPNQPLCRNTTDALFVEQSEAHAVGARQSSDPCTTPVPPTNTPPSVTPQPPISNPPSGGGQSTPPTDTPPPPPSGGQPQTDGAAFVDQSGYPNINAGDQVGLYFDMQNTGSTTWTDGAYYLACTANCLGAGNVGLNGQSVAPGQTYRFSFTVTAPQSPGLYRNTWLLMHSGNGFGPGLWSDVTVHGWNKLIDNDYGPSCNIPASERWSSPNPQAIYTDCNNNDFHIRQQNAATPLKYAEQNLDLINNGAYDQYNFYTQVQATFTNPGDTATLAAIIVQTPRANGATGGYIFGILPSGHWRIQQVINGGNIPTIQDGYVGSASSYTMTVRVQNGQLFAAINGTQVAGPISDNLGSDAEMGLMAQHDGAYTSSTIQYNYFTLAVWQ